MHSNFITREGSRAHCRCGNAKPLFEVHNVAPAPGESAAEAAEFMREPRTLHEIKAFADAFMARIKFRPVGGGFALVLDPLDDEDEWGAP